MGGGMRRKLFGAALVAAALTTGIVLGMVRTGSATPDREALAAAARQARTSVLERTLRARALAAVKAPRTTFPAKLPPLQAGKVVRVTIPGKDATVEIAPGVRYRA